MKVKVEKYIQSSVYSSFARDRIACLSWFSDCIAIITTDEVSQLLLPDFARGSSAVEVESVLNKGQTSFLNH
jgi:hypothetical protein